MAAVEVVHAVVMVASVRSLVVLQLMVPAAVVLEGH